MLTIENRNQWSSSFLPQFKDYFLITGISFRLGSSKKNLTSLSSCGVKGGSAFHPVALCSLQEQSLNKRGKFGLRNANWKEVSFASGWSSSCTELSKSPKRFSNSGSFHRLL